MAKELEPMFSSGCGYGSGEVLQYKIVRTSDPFKFRRDAVYSLAVIRTRGDGDCESYFAYDVSRSFSNAEKIAKLLCRMTVFPENVREVLYDRL